MRTVFGIVARDLRALAKNPIALLVVGALLVLPGLYAWYCIVANWDPYSNTGNMPIAVVNKDEGASNSLTGEVNIGKQVIEKLEGNDSIDWKIYDSEEEALEDTRYAFCYATIVFPKDLSKNVVGIFEGSTDPPVIDYYPNEKYNAVATKVSDSAAQKLVRQINQQFSSTVNETILKSVQRVSDDAEGHFAQNRNSVTVEIQSVREDIDRIIASLDDTLASIEFWKVACAGANDTLDATDAQLPLIEEALASGSADVGALQAKTSDFEGRLNAEINKSSATLSGISARASSNLKQANANLESIHAQVQAAQQAVDVTSITDPGVKADAQLLLASLNLLNALISDAVANVDQKVAEIDAHVQTATGKVTSVSQVVNADAMPKLTLGASQLSTSLSGISGSVAQFKPQIAQFKNVLAQTGSALDVATAALNDAKSLLSSISDHLSGTVNDLGALRQALQVDKIADLLNMSPESVGSFISMPVQMETQKVFPVSNYGTAVAPFYTNLALWIGCFILVSLMKLEVNPVGFEGATGRQRYFGRWLLLVILALLQSQVICGVDILLGIDCANPALFMLAGAVCSFVYMNIIFALAITFRNIGKTLCIVLLIMQVPGSSGMYPIEMMPDFFRFIHPALPFTYGIDAMREALCGMKGLEYVLDLAVLLLIVPFALLLGLVIRPRMMNVNHMFDKEMAATGFFASEVHGQESDNARVVKMMRTLASNDSYRDEIEERALRFNRRYPVMRRVGSAAAFIIPFAFLLLMLPFNLFGTISTDVKLAALVVMLLLLLVVAFALLVLEYMHRTISDEARLLGLSLLESEGMSYSTIVEQADDAVTNMGQRAAAAREEASAELLKANPPLSDAVMGMIPATETLGQSGNEPALRRGGVIRDIFRTDLRLGLHSVVGVVVVVLLVITPSLYAWFNIAGSWDPYGSTGNLKVAVANEDEGYKGDLIPITLNVGNTLVSQLRGNTGFNWQFVAEKSEAVNGVESGEYYAAIVIPSDFSSNLFTYLTENASYPNVQYYTNEKENPIAPIITQKGADSIQESIRASFTESVDGVVLSVAYDLLKYVTNPRVSDYVSKMSGHLDDAIHDMDNGSRELGVLSSLAGTTSAVVDSTGTALSGVKGAADSAKPSVATAREAASNASAAIDSATSAVGNAFDGQSIDLVRIEGTIDTALGLLRDGSTIVPARLDSYVQDVDALLARPEVQSDASLSASLQALRSSLVKAREHSAGVPDNVTRADAELKQSLEDAKTNLGQVRSYFSDEMKPQVNDLRTKLGTAVDSTENIVGGLDNTLNGLSGSTGGLSSQLSSLSSGLEKGGGKLAASADSLKDTKERIAKALSSGDVKQIEDVVLGSDPESLAASLAVPIRENREAMFAVSNYGSSMAPFYTVLSLWVGALVMISTMRTRLVGARVEELRSRFASVRPGHEYFGRYGIFGLIALMQSSLVLLGDLLFLNIQCANPVAFFLFGLFIGQVFCLIVYTLTELFGDVGKAVCVILLIMQVAASGGTFPVEMLDPLLEYIVPFLPFWHAMSLLQECVAGIEWSAAAIRVAALLVIGGAMPLIGVVVRKPFRRVNDFFEAQLEKTGFM